MLVKEISIPDGFMGLHGFKMTRLERIVLLTGPNGGGKSRVLLAVEVQCGKYPLERELGDLQKRLSELDFDIAQLLESKKKPHWPERIEIYDAQLRISESKRQEIINRISARDGIIFGSARHEHPSVIKYSTNSIDLRDWQDQAFNTANQIVSGATRQIDLQPIATHIVSLIRAICANFFMASGIPNSPEAALREAEHRYLRLRDSIRGFLGVNLDWDPNTMGPTLFGHPLHDPPLSEGQKILLAVATSLALQDGSQENLILLLDEPEKHLHPKALLELLNHLDKACPHAQIWIATHSVHVLAHYGEKAIWSVRDGKAQHAGREWSSVLESLIGSSEHSDRVRSFLGLPAEHAMLSFAAECLIPPAVVDTEAGDPQTTQIAEFLKGVRSEGKPMRVLDFGAGQGRLLGELMAQSQNFAQDFDYFAYDQADVKDEHKARCLSRLSECYSSNGMSHYLSGTGSIRNNLNPKSVDCLILCNVLHEVDPKDWISLLGSNGEIYECLADHGVLLIVEDQLLRDGERAHTYNFLVLSEPELKALFGASPESQDIMSKAHPKYPDRLKIHRVPKRLLAQVTADTRAAALRKLVSNAQINAHALKGGRDAANGRLYGFWAMQHFNATEALADMSG